MEDESAGLSGGAAHIGHVSSSKTGQTIRYRDRAFRRIEGGGGGSEANDVDIETGDEFWISGPRRDGADRLHGERVPVEIGDDVRDEHWTEIRGQPHRRLGTDASR